MRRFLASQSREDRIVNFMKFSKYSLRFGKDHGIIVYAWWIQQNECFEERLR